MLVFCLVFTSSVQALDIVVDIQDNAPVDIIMAKGKSGFDVGPFKEKLTKSLKKYGIDMDRVYIDSAETYSLNVTDQDPSRILSDWSVFHQQAIWRYDPEKRAIIDPEYHCYRSGYYNKDAYVGGKIIYECDIRMNSHAYNDYYGVSFCMNGTKDYYAVLWGHGVRTSDRDWECAGYLGQPVYGLCIMKVEDCTCVSGSVHCPHATMLAVAGGSWSPNRTYHYKITLDNGKIEAQVGYKRLVAYDDEFKGGAYGLIDVSHGSGWFSNIRITGESSKDLVDVVRAPNWRPQSHRFIVDLTDESREEFDNNFKLGELIERIEIDNAHYLGIGTSLSQDSINNFIARNEGNGIYLARDSNTEDELYDKMAEYIAKIVNSRVSGSGDVMLLKDYDYRYNYKFQ